MPLELKVWGDYALFTRPETKSEPITYPVITATAAQGILEAVYWSPCLYYKINFVKVLNPITTMGLVINGIKNRVTSAQVLNWANYKSSDGYSSVQMRTQKHHTILCDVSYVINFDIKLLGEANEQQIQYHCDKFVGRAKYGRCFHQPFLGCKEFVCYFELAKGDETVANELANVTLPLGLFPVAIQFIKSTKQNRVTHKAYNIETNKLEYAQGYFDIEYKKLQLDKGYVFY